jgi:type III secretion protein V
VLTVPPAAGADARLEDHEICFQVNDLRSPASDALGPGEWLMLTGGDAVASAGIVATTFTDPAGEVFPRVAGDAPLLARCRELGKTEGAGGVIAFGLRERMCAEAANLLTVESVECLLDVLHETDGVLVDAAADRFDHAVLAWILRDLVASGVPVRDLRGILEALMSIEGSRARADGSVTPQAVAYWADWVRCEFRRQISSRHLAGREVMTLWLVAPDLEARIAGLHAEPLTEQERGRLFASLLAAYDQDPESPFVVLTTIEASRPLRALIRQELPTAAVLSFHELGPELYIKPLGRIGEL